MPNHERGVERAINSSWPVLERYFDTPAWRASGTDPASIMRGMPWAQWMQEAGAVVEPLADATAQAFGAEYATIGSVKGKLGFDVIDNVSIKYAQTQGSKLITAITEAQRETVRTMVAEGLKGDWTVDQLGRKIRGTVGLHPAWAQAVVRFEDRQYNALIAEGKSESVAAATAARRAEIKRKRLLKARGLNIARTEVQTASNLGKFASWDHAISKGFASRQSTKEFSPGPGACEICSPISGEVVPWDQPFSNGKMMPPFHPSCRCTANLLPPDYNDADLDPDAFDWLSDADVNNRPEFVPDIAGRVGSLINRPAPFVAPPVAMPTPLPVPAPAPAPAPAGSAADSLTLDSTAHLSDDDLMGMLGDYGDDPEAIDKILEIIDQRDANQKAWAAFDAAEEGRLAAEAAERNVWGEVELPPHTELSSVLNPARNGLRGLTVDEQVAEDFFSYVQVQYSKALDETAGNFFNKRFEAEAKRKGITSEDLFMGPVATAQKYASEELIAWWEENGRHTKGSFRYTTLQRPRDRKRWEQVQAAGFAGRLVNGADRSTF